MLVAVAGAGLCSCASSPPQPPPQPAPAADAGTPAPLPVPQVAAEMTLADARRVQAEVMDFADDMMVRLAEAIDRIEVAASSVESRVVAHRLRYTVAQGAITIAAAQNPRIALVDMLVMISLQRALLERNVAPRYFGPEAAGLLALFESAENQIRGLAAGTLTTEQITEIDGLIARWLEENPDRIYAAYVRMSEFAGARQVTTGQAVTGRPSNVLGFLFIDPLSGLDPTTREIEQARLFAERAFFYLQRAPQLVSWQAELLFLDAVTEPEAVRLVGSVETAASAAERATATVETLRGELPGIIAAEREAALQQAAAIIERERRAAIGESFAALAAERAAVIEQLADEEARLGALAGELRLALEAGTAFSDSLRGTTGAFGRLSEQLGIGGPENPDKPEGEPFRITDYTEALREATRAAEELTRLTESLTGATDPATLEARLALVDRRLAEAEASGDRLLGRAFRLGAGLIGLLVVGGAGVVALAWWLRRRAA